MIVINQTTANQMIADNSSLKTITDIYERTYLVGTGSEILVLPDDSNLITKIQDLINTQKGVLYNGNSLN